ncbi:hypothetical protein M3603_01960 [Rummeliibacillus stabekisii]|uniref:hypothetical protein n=1 Tax=Rummeliibacillus stabekisii TaxID=241244 RepID=UPI00203E4098|nr:hypothetical protein [Rummeliibacillus stabekisii]MCM3315425.1 hypothetical protein [Rummeliibacillus stabekisii]
MGKMVDRDQLYYMQIDGIIQRCKTLSVPCHIQTISTLTGLNDEKILELIECNYKNKMISRDNYFFE